MPHCESFKYRMISRRRSCKYGRKKTKRHGCKSKPGRKTRRSKRRSKRISRRSKKCKHGHKKGKKSCKKEARS